MSISCENAIIYRFAKSCKFTEKTAQNKFIDEKSGIFSQTPDSTLHKLITI